MSHVNYNELIELNRDVRFGRPVIKGTRIAVHDVQKWLGSGMTVDEIIRDFPQLKKEGILACINYSS